MSKFERYVTFYSVIGENSFAGASKRLGISSAAISKQVTKLEEEIGVQLLKRSTRKLELTEAGALFFENVSKFLYEIEEFEALFSEMRKEPFGCLCIGGGRYFIEKYVIPHLGEFNQLYPKVSFQFKVHERRVDLGCEGIDVNLGHTVVGGQNDIHRKIFTTRYVLCASPLYLQKFGTPKVPQDILNHRYITHGMRAPDHVLEFDEEEIHVAPFMRVNDTLLMKQCALQGIGIVKMHHYVVADELKEKRLIEILEQYDNTTQPIYLCYQPTRYLKPKIRHFIDFLVRKMEK